MTVPDPMTEIHPAKIAFLKTRPTGRRGIDAIKERIEIGMEGAEFDPMVSRIDDIIKNTTFSGRILDAGCFGGYLYNRIGRPEGYIGIDIWEEAITAAQELFPEADFRVCNLFDFNEKVDFVWCSQLLLDEKDARKALLHFQSISEHGAFALPQSCSRWFEANTFDDFGKTHVKRW